jgi:hypothetical protein
MMKLFWVYGEDTPHKGDGAPFKSYMVAAGDETEARSVAPPAFRVDGIELLKVYHGPALPPSRLGYVGAAHPQMRGQG